MALPGERGMMATILFASIGIGQVLYVYVKFDVYDQLIVRQMICIDSDSSIQFSQFIGISAFQSSITTKRQHSHNNFRCS